MKAKVFVHVILAVFFIQQSKAQRIAVSEKQDVEALYSVDLYPAFKDAKTQALSFIAEDIMYIPLEKTDSCLIDKDLQVFMGENDIFVFDYTNCFRFSKQGKFLNQIGKRGRGPGEYTRPMGFEIDDKKKELFFIDSDVIRQYDFEGNFITKYKTGVKSMRLKRLNADVFIVDDMFFQYKKPKDRFSMRFFSLNEKKQIAKFECPNKGKIPFCIDIPAIYAFNNNTFIKDYWGNTVYKVESPETLSPYLQLNTGKLKSRDKDDLRPFGKKNVGDDFVISFSQLSEAERYIFMFSNKGLFVFDKTNHTTSCCSFQQKGEIWYTFSNDLNGGPVFNAHSFPRTLQGASTFISYNHAYQFFDEDIDTSNPQIKKLLKTLSPEDNPVIAIVNLKR